MSVINWNERTEIVKDPTDEVFKHFSYERWLVGNAVLANSDWAVTCADEVSPTLIADQDSITNAGVYATVRLTGGTPGKTYTLTNTVETNEATPQIAQRSVDVVVREL